MSLKMINFSFISYCRLFLYYERNPGKLPSSMYSIMFTSWSLATCTQDIWPVRRWRYWTCSMAACTWRCTTITWLPHWPIKRHGGRSTLRQCNCCNWLRYHPVWCRLCLIAHAPSRNSPCWDSCFCRILFWSASLGAFINGPMLHSLPGKQKKMSDCMYLL